MVGACLWGGTPLPASDDDAGGSSTSLDDDGGFARTDVDLGDPFALYGLTPSHGPYAGGSTVRLTGRGFTPSLRVFIGDKEVAAVAGDPTRAVVVTPPGTAGWADVKIRDDASAMERVLKKGFLYDSVVVSPATGATSGGTRITISNGGAPWTARNEAGVLGTSGLHVSIGGVPCTDLGVPANPDDVRTLDCTTPPGSPGARDVTVDDADGHTIAQARDAFTYSDSPDGARGGLGGQPFAGRVRVLAFDATLGTPLAGAWVIAGSSVATGIVQQTAITGVTEISGLPGAKVTITVGAKCHQPMTYVDVPVDNVTVYLPAVMDVACASGDPPSTGGNGGIFGGIVDGQLVFPGGAEFKRTGWTTVPAPSRPTERRAAYVFDAVGSPSQTFVLPPANEAITPDTPGTNGYSFSHLAYPGNVTLYIVAGLEDRTETPPRFLPYAMGVARGISLPPQTHVTGIDVKMDILFDHQVTVAAGVGIPPAGPNGPDRFAATLAMTLGASAYALLPRGLQVAPYPVPATLPFIGVPSLDHGVAGEQYLLGAIAATGPGLTRPASVVSRIRTTNANDPVSLGGFLGIPVVAEPTAGTWGGTHVELSGLTGQPNVELVQIRSGQGLVTWTIVAPGGVTSLDVPDLRALPGPDTYGLRAGAIDTTVYSARIDDLAYGQVRQGQLTTGAWNAYAFDAVSSAY